MPNLFDGYCYASVTDAATAEIAQPAHNDGTGVSVAVSASPINATDATITFNHKPFNLGSASSYAITRTYPACTDVGYLHNYSGVTLSEVVETSWLVVAVWVAAWSIKQMRRGA